MKLCWLTDLHLNRYPEFLNRRLLDKAKQCDGILVTGDISTGFRTEEHLEFLKKFSPNVYFVLGNHDFYGSSFEETSGRVRQVCRNGRATWLDDADPIALGRGTYLIGVDGWYDAQYGDAFFLDVNFDRMMIRDLLLKTKREQRSELMASRAQISADKFRQKLKLVPSRADKVIIATHYPPWIGPMRSIFDAFWLPQSVNSILGDAIVEEARNRGPITQFEVLCGHVHKDFEMNPAQNVKCIVSDARKINAIIV
jgi:3',5'-cyclic-AMP phosphodiesterase